MASSFAANTLLVVMLLTAASSCSSSVVCRRNLQQECPIPTTTVLDLTAAAAQCVTSSPNFCAGCSCGLISAFAPSLASAGVFASAAAFNNVTAAASAGSAALSPCVMSFMDQFTTAGVNLGSITALNSCPFTIVPQCLVDQLCPLVNCNSTTSAPIPGRPRQPLPPPPPPSVSAAFYITLRVPVSYQQNEPSRAAAVALLQRNMADNLDMPPQAVRISNVSFPVLSHRALLAPTAAVPMHMLVTVTQLLLLHDVADTTAQLNSLVYNVVLDPRRFIDSSVLLQIGVNPADPILAEVVASPPSSLPPSPGPPVLAPRPSSSPPSPSLLTSLPTQAAPATPSSPSSRAKVLGPAIAIPIGLAVLAGVAALTYLVSRRRSKKAAAETYAAPPLPQAPAVMVDA